MSENQNETTREDESHTDSPAKPTQSKLPSSANAIVTVMKLELLGRVRSKKWIIALVVWVAVLLLTWLGTLGFAKQFMGSSDSSLSYQTLLWTFCMLLFFTLAVTLVVAPALSSTSINGDWETANLAILQVTPITAGQLLWGKLLAAWISGIVFAAAGAIPLTIMTAIHGLGFRMLVISLAIIVVEVFVVCALGLGFSALVSRPVASVLLTYLVLGALTVGGPMAFAFTITSSFERIEYKTMTLIDKRPADNPEVLPFRSDGYDEYCHAETHEDMFYHHDRFWYLLATSPFVILPDAATGLQSGQRALQEVERKQNYGSVYDSPFSAVSVGVAASRAPSPTAAEKLRQLTEVPKPFISISDTCYVDENHQSHPAYDNRQLLKIREDFENQNQKAILRLMGHSWYWGLGLHVALAIGAVVTAWRRLRTPVRHLPKGVRIA